MLKVSLMAVVIEQILNGLLFDQNHQDTAIKEARQQLDGKCLQLELDEFSAPIALIFSKNHLDILLSWEGKVHCVVKSRLSLLTTKYNDEQLTSLIQSDELNVEGDIAVLQQFFDLSALTKWDLAEYLAPYFGDIMAYNVDSTISSIWSLVKRSLKRNRDYSSGVIVEEWRLAPGILEFMHFCDHIDQLQYQYDRLMSRMEKLEAL